MFFLFFVSTIQHIESFDELDIHYLNRHLLITGPRRNSLVKPFVTPQDCNECSFGTRNEKLVLAMPNKLQERFQIRSYGKVVIWARPQTWTGMLQEVDFSRTNCVIATILFELCDIAIVGLVM